MNNPHPLFRSWLRPWFVTIANVVDSLNDIFFLLGEYHLLFSCMDCHTCPSIFQWNCLTYFCVTVTQCSFNEYKPPYCFLLFNTLPLFCLDCRTFLPLFLCETVPPFFVWMSHKYPAYLLPYICVNVTHARLHFLCVNVTRISLCLHYF